jgi:hypothetical protein
VIEFEPSVQNPRLLRRAVRIALKKKDYIPSLSDLAPRLTVDQLIQLGKSWQKHGLGSIIEASEDGKRSVLFSLNDTAVSVVADMSRRSLRGRLGAVPRSEWIALAALAVSALSAYFTYLATRSH